MSLTLNEHMESGERPLAARLLDVLKRKEEQLAIAMGALEAIANSNACATLSERAGDAIRAVRNISNDNQQPK